MKFIIDLLRPDYTDVFGQIAVRTKQPSVSRPHGVGIEMHDLSAGMYSGISAPRTSHLNRFIRNLT